MSVLSDQQGKAVVMISDHGIDPSVVLFQLQTSQDVVKCSVALHGGLNPDSKNTFLASASFDFDLEDAGTFSSLLVISHPSNKLIFWYYDV